MAAMILDKETILVKNKTIRKTNKIDTTKINRNLHFKSPITELSAQLEFNFMNYETRKHN